MKGKLLFLIIVFSSIVELSQAGSLPGDTLMVVEIAQSEGLSQLGAATMASDQKGYLWIGTQNGLNRFNGYGMKVYHSREEPGGLRDDHIRSIHYAGDTLWLATNTKGILAYNMADDEFIDFRQYIDLKRYPNLKYAYVLYAPDNRNLIAGTIGHCIWVDRRTMAFNIIPLPKIKDNDFVTGIIRMGQGKFLVGTNASGIVILSEKDKVAFADPVFDELVNSQINCLFQHHSTEILIGTNQGLYQYDIAKKKLDRLSEHTVRSLQRWDEETILVGGLHKNYLMLDDFVWKEVVFVNHLGKVLQADILSFAQDDQGGRWIGTESRGVYYFHSHRRKFVPKRIEANNMPKQDFISTFNFLRDRDDIWMASEFGFIKHRLGTERYKVYRTDLLEYALARDVQGQIWGGGFGQGLVKYNRQKDRFDQIPLPFEDLDIIQITPVHRDSLWVHTWSSGIYSLNIHDYSTRSISILGRKLLRSRISLIDRKGHVWIGTEEGVYQIRPQGAVHYDSLSNPRVFSLAEDTEGHIWVGTARGLNRIAPATGEVVHYLQQPGLPNDFIYAAEVDGHDNVWVSTNYGLSVLNKQSMTFRNYTEDDGLQNNEFNGKAGYRDSLGNLYFGGMNGFNIFHPDSVFTNSKVGKTWIEDVRLFGKSLPENILYTDTLVFLHDQNVISFDFASLNFLWPGKNRYQYMLVGFDDQWRPVTREMSATYTNLDPGAYVFRVRGSNNELLWGDYDEITVIIKSPWYQTWWFRILFALALLFLVVGFFVNKQLQQKKINQRLLQMVDERTEELNESLHLTRQQKESIMFLMQELNHRVKNNLQLITSLIDIQSFEIDDPQVQDKLSILQSRVFVVSKMHDLLNVRNTNKEVSTEAFISSLAQDLITFSGQDIRFRSGIEEAEMPSNKLTYLGIILNELITNSIKHAFGPAQEDKLISISLTRSQREIMIRYRDNGVGFDRNQTLQGEHQGMELIRSLIDELKGDMQVDTDHGAVFTITLPKY